MAVVPTGFDMRLGARMRKRGPRIGCLLGAFSVASIFAVCLWWTFQPGSGEYGTSLTMVAEDGFGFALFFAGVHHRDGGLLPLSNMAPRSVHSLVVACGRNPAGCLGRIRIFVSARAVLARQGAGASLGSYRPHVGSRVLRLGELDFRLLVRRGGCERRRLRHPRRSG